MGGIVTAIAIVCAVVPTSDVHRIWLFELKIHSGNRRDYRLGVAPVPTCTQNRRIGQLLASAFHR
jgi:hypothetical protein